MPRLRIASLPIHPSFAEVKNEQKESTFDNIIAGLLQVHNPTPIFSPTLSSNLDYRSMPTTEERLKHALLIFRRDVLDPFKASWEYDVEATPEYLKKAITSHLASQRTMGLSHSECDELCHDIIVTIAAELKGIDPYRVLKVLGKLCISSFDTVTDVIFTTRLAFTRPGLALVQGGALLFCFAIQSFASYILGQPWWVMIAGLFGLKPVVEAWRDGTDAKPFPNQKLSNEYMLFLTRMIEITAEAIPQALIQALTLMIVPRARTSIGYISLLSSIATSGFTVAFSTREIDLSKAKRRSEPLYFGFVSKTNAFLQMVLHFVFFTAYKAAKIFSLALLIASSSFHYAVIFPAIECLLLLICRTRYNSWRFYVGGADGIIFSLLAHLGLYLSLVATPFPAFRHPAFLSPRIYSLGILCNLGANFLLVYFSFNVSVLTTARQEIPESSAWMFLTFTTLLCFFSGSVAFFYVPKNLKPSFYRHITLQQHISTFIWNDQALATGIDHSKITDQVHIRALIPIKTSKHYTPKALLVNFYEDKWAGWCAEPPYWFDEEFMAKVPRDLLVKVDESMWDGKVMADEP